VEIHGDSAQFNPNAVYTALPYMMAGYDFMIGSRFRNLKRPLEFGMPKIRFLANLGLSFMDRLILKLPLTEFHTGFRIYGKVFADKIPIQFNTSNYLFSFEVFAQAAFFRLKVAEVPVDADYRLAHTSHHVLGAAMYALSNLRVLSRFLLSKSGLLVHRTFNQKSETT